MKKKFETALRTASVIATTPAHAAPEKSDRPERISRTPISRWIQPHVLGPRSNV